MGKLTRLKNKKDIMKGHNMKKSVTGFLALILAVCMLVSGCDEKTNPESDSTTPKNPASDSVQSESSKEDSGEDWMNATQEKNLLKDKMDEADREKLLSGSTVPNPQINLWVPVEEQPADIFDPEETVTPEPNKVLAGCEISFAGFQWDTNYQVDIKGTHFAMVVFGNELTEEEFEKVVETISDTYGGYIYEEKTIWGDGVVSQTCTWDTELGYRDAAAPRETAVNLSLSCSRPVGEEGLRMVSITYMAHLADEA